MRFEKYIFGRFQILVTIRSEPNPEGSELNLIL